MKTTSNPQFQHFESLVRGEYAAYFSGPGPIACARAPGRLDVMGGVADYSGGTVLEGTLSEATLAAVQSNSSDIIQIRSISAGDAGLAQESQLPLERLFFQGGCLPEEEVRTALNASTSTRWAAYVIGCIYILVAEHHIPAGSNSGLKLLIDSSVPIGAGVSSSAALEVASMTAICSLYGLSLDGLEIARLCQMVENRIAGAPCGIMDQVTSALGRERELLVLKCQPHEILGYVAIPPGCSFIGIDSGVKHSVGGGHYIRARVGAFMGLKILQTQGLISAMSRDSDHERQQYLCNMSVAEWNDWKRLVPERMTGSEFLSRYRELPDTVTKIDPDALYTVRSCTEHPILENDRVRQFIALLSMAGLDPDSLLLEECGQLMLEAHRSYSERLGLGSEETDLLKDLAMSRGPEGGIYGAKITGGGSGGTVAMLCSGPSVEESIAWIAGEYQRRTGIQPTIMRGSSEGAVDFGVRWLNLAKTE